MELKIMKIKDLEILNIQYQFKMKKKEKKNK